MTTRSKTANIKANRACPAEREINILLFGQTGVGKSTFINGFANYLCNDTLEQAVNDQMQSIIPSSFSFTDPTTSQEKLIKTGEADEYENLNGEKGESCTQQCRSYVFPAGDRNLRIIDAPGIGDTRGIEQDKKNFREILTYISQYEHLNGICILLKPNEERLTILFKFCINELLRHINLGASDNIIFIFTNARATFFAPGSTKQILTALLDEHEQENDVQVPFSRQNSFLLDNEPYRYLALRRNGIELNEDQTISYQKSWDHSVDEYCKLISYILTRPLYAVSNILSLNEAEQLVKKLTRPIAETAKLIEQNLQLAQQHKKDVAKNPKIAAQGLPQNDVRIVKLDHPRTVCVGKNCCRVIMVNNEQKIEHTSKCHEECYLKGVQQETINDERMLECEVIDPDTGKCNECGCSWEQHQHITYEYVTNLTHLEDKSSLADIDKRITDLREEKAKIEEVYKKLAKFLHANAMLPINDDIIEYLRHFIQEEQMKRNAGSQNTDVIEGLEQMIKDYQEEMDLFKKTIKNDKDQSNARDVLKSDDIFSLVGTLYRLPINGPKIREQVNGLKITQQNISAHREIFVELPAKAASSKVMLQFKGYVSSR